MRKSIQHVSPSFYRHDETSLHSLSASWIHTGTQSIFLSLSRMHISVFEVMGVYLIDQYQNPILRVMQRHELKTSRAFQAHDKGFGFNWSSEKALHKRLIAEWWRGV